MEGKVRLLRRSESPEEGLVLRAGRREEPPPGAMERAASALGISGILATSAGGAQAAGLGLKALVGKWALVSAAGVSTLFGGWNTWQEASLGTANGRTTAVAVSVPSRTGHELPSSLDRAVIDERTSAKVDVTAPPSVPSVRASVARSSPRVTLADEVRMIDQARRALQAGEVTRAFSELNAYERSAGKRVLRQEASLLRVEALAALGQRTKARELATRFLLKNPKSTHRTRLESLLGAL